MEPLLYMRMWRFGVGYIHGGYWLLESAPRSVCPVLSQRLVSLHWSAYKTLKNLRSSLQGKLERQPLGTIQEKGRGNPLKDVYRRHRLIELLLAHAPCRRALNVAVPLFVFIAMFFVDWKLALLSLCALPLGLIAMGAMYKAGHQQMGALRFRPEDEQHHCEYINGMEVVKVFNRDGESYKRF